jgi:hypothetical protein
MPEWLGAFSWFSNGIGTTSKYTIMKGKTFHDMKI